MWQRALSVGGGGGHETSLWTNPSPSSNYTEGSASLSDDINNYEYLEFQMKNSTTDANPNFFIRLSVSSIKSAGLGVFVGNQSGWTRRVGYTNDTTISITRTYEIAGSGRSDNQMIPYQILGIS